MAGQRINWAVAHVGANFSIYRPHPGNFEPPAQVMELKRFPYFAEFSPNTQKTIYKVVLEVKNSEVTLCQCDTNIGPAPAGGVLKLEYETALWIADSAKWTAYTADLISVALKRLQEAYGLIYILWVLLGSYHSLPQAEHSQNDYFVHTLVKKHSSAARKPLPSHCS